MLTAYEVAVAALLQSPSSPIPLIPTATIDTYINTARNQVAADGECIRVPGFLTLITGQSGYNFSSITVSTVMGQGLVIAARSAKIAGQPLDWRGWEWFQQYYLSGSAVGTPIRIAQWGQGTLGTIYFYPTPNAAMTVLFDAVCLPVPLINDGTPEAIPELWTDAVPFYAAWLGMQQLQRQADADMMLKRYESLVKRGRQFATPTELPENLPGGLGAQVASTHQPLSGGQQR